MMIGDTGGGKCFPSSKYNNYNQIHFCNCIGCIQLFSEPNRPDQSDLDPELAAIEHVKLQELYPDKVMVSPATGNIDIETTKALGYADGVVPTQGGLPFSAGGRFLGGIGVSGADSATDEECAQAGIDAVADDLEFAE